MTELPAQNAATTPAAQHPLSVKEDGTPDIPDTDVEEVLRRQVPLRVRLVQSLGLLIVMAVVTVVADRSVATTPGRSPVGVDTPTPVPLGPILVLSNVSYGMVTLNGVRLAGSPPLVATFQRGMNTITLSAPPFHPRICHVQWPGRQNDGACDFPPMVGLPHTVVGRPISPVLIVELPFGLEDLPSAAQTQALAAVSDALQSTPPQTVVPAGEYIAIGQDTSGGIISRRTDVLLQAELLAAAIDLVYIGDAFCVDPGCVPIGIATSGGRPAWVVAVNITVRWQFSSSTEALVTSTPWSAQLPNSLLLTYDAQQGWSVDQRGSQKLAGFDLPAALAQTICNLDDISVLSTAAQQYDDVLLPALHDHRLQGCELGLQTGLGANAGRFVWRFGVLLAEDEQAHALLPALPLAPASEEAAVGA
jgi:hypothetical protein